MLKIGLHLTRSTTMRTIEKGRWRIALILPGISTGKNVASTCNLYTPAPTHACTCEIGLKISNLWRNSLSLRQSHEYVDAPKVFPRSSQASDDEESAKVIAQSAALSILLIPSLKEVSIQISCRLLVFHMVSRGNFAYSFEIVISLC